MTGNRTVSDKTHQGLSAQNISAAELVPVSFETLVERVNELSWRVKRSEHQVGKLAELESSMSVLLEKMQSRIPAPAVATERPEIPAVAQAAPPPPAAKTEASSKITDVMQGKSSFTPVIVGVAAFFAAAAIAAAGYLAYQTYFGTDNQAQAKTGSVIKEPEKAPAKSKGEQPENTKQGEAASKLSTGSVEKKQASNSQTVEKPKNNAPAAATSSLVTDDIPEGIFSASVVEKARAGNYYAQYEVGVYFSDKNSRHYDAKRSAHWMMKSAQQGYPLAQFWLASMYEHGSGTEKDVQRSLYWYEQAARGGHVSAMFNLAVMNASGFGGKKDFGQTALWMRQAADHGLKNAQYNMGMLHLMGAGVEKSSLEAARWLHIASSRGDSRATKKLAELEKTMPPHEYDQAQKLAAQWQAVPADKNANVFPAGGSGESRSSAAEPSPQVELSSANIQEIQAFLNALGYDAGTPDGNVGPKTREAVRQFQAANGLAPSGEINLEFLKKLTNRPG